MNYGELKQAIQDYTDNTETTFVNNLPLFIRAAEERILKGVQLQFFRRNQAASVTSGNKYLACPADFLATYSLAVIDDTGSYEYLLNKDVNFIRQSFPSPTDTGKPQYYAIFGPTTTNDTPPVITNEYSFILGPTPDAAYSVELHYYYYPESIVTASTTWLADNFSSVLLYGSLLEAYTFMKGEPDVLAGYQKRYDEAMILAKRLGDGMERGDAYRDGQVKIPVM